MEGTSAGRAGAWIPIEDLNVVTQVVMLRLASPEAEEERVERMTHLLWAGSELTRALSVHTQHALVHSRGSHGTADLRRDTAALHRAMSRYAELVSSVAAEYRALVSVRESRSPNAQQNASAIHVEIA